MSYAFKNTLPGPINGVPQAAIKVRPGVQTLKSKSPSSTSFPTS